MSDSAFAVSTMIQWPVVTSHDFKVFHFSRKGCGEDYGVFLGVGKTFGVSLYCLTILLAGMKVGGVDSRGGRFISVGIGAGNCYSVIFIYSSVQFAFF